MAPPTRLRLELPRETGIILRCAGKAGNPFQTTQGNRLSPELSAQGLVPLPLSLLAVQESHSPEALLAAGLGATEGFPEETAGLGGIVRGTISGFLGSPKLSVLVWPSSALILETTVLRLCSALIVFIAAWPSGQLAPSHRGGGRLGAASSCAATGLLREFCSLT